SVVVFMASNLSQHHNKSINYLTMYSGVRFLVPRLFHLKPAGGRWSADAVFFHWRSNYLGEQRFHQQTCFGMVRRRGSNWAAVAVDEMLAIFFTKSRRAA